MGDARPPHSFNYEASDLKKEWTDWFQGFGFYLTASKKNNEKDEVKIAILLNQLGKRGIEIYNTLKDDKEAALDGDVGKTTVFAKYQEVVEALSEHFSPRRNVLHERFKFNRLSWQKGEPLLEFITNLKTAAATCDFEERDNMIRDRIISQMSEEDLLNRLLDKGDKLNLEETIKMCKLHVSRKTEIKDIAGGSSQPSLEDVDAIRTKQYNKVPHKKTTSDNTKYHCKKCGTTHEARKCPAYGKRCNVCKGFNHFEVGCFIKKRNESKKVNYKNKRYTRAVEVDEASSDDSFYVDYIKVDNVNIKVDNVN